MELHHGLYRPMTAALERAMVDRARPMAGVPGVLVLREADLFVVLSVHFATGVGVAQWVWLLDLVLLSGHLDEADWRAMRGEIVASGLQVYLHTALLAGATFWPEASGTLARWAAGEEGGLGRWERRAGRRFVEGLLDERLRGDLLAVSRVLARRPLRGRRGMWRSIVAPPGVVANELGVSSTSPGFGLWRLRHTVARVMRGAAALRGLFRVRRP